MSVISAQLRVPAVAIEAPPVVSMPAKKSAAPTIEQQQREHGHKGDDTDYTDRLSDMRFMPRAFIAFAYQ